MRAAGQAAHSCSQPGPAAAPRPGPAAACGAAWRSRPPAQRGAGAAGTRRAASPMAHRARAATAASLTLMPHPSQGRKGRWKWQTARRSVASCVHDAAQRPLRTSTGSWLSSSAMRRVSLRVPSRKGRRKKRMKLAMTSTVNTSASVWSVKTSLGRGTRARTRAQVSRRKGLFAASQPSGGLVGHSREGVEHDGLVGVHQPLVPPTHVRQRVPCEPSMGVTGALLCSRHCRSQHIASVQREAALALTYPAVLGSAQSGILRRQQPKKAW